jgi:hypothetical protein
MRKHKANELARPFDAHAAEQEHVGEISRRSLEIARALNARGSGSTPTDRDSQITAFGHGYDSPRTHKTLGGKTQSSQFVLSSHHRTDGNTCRGFVRGILVVERRRWGFFAVRGLRVLEWSESNVQHSAGFHVYLLAEIIRE